MGLGTLEGVSIPFLKAYGTVGLCLPECVSSEDPARGVLEVFWLVGSHGKIPIEIFTEGRAKIPLQLGKLDFRLWGANRAPQN